MPMRQNIDKVWHKMYFSLKTAPSLWKLKSGYKKCIESADVMWVEHHVYHSFQADNTVKLFLKKIY